jgi:hypothetical protein
VPGHATPNERERLASAARARSAVVDDPELAEVLDVLASEIAAGHLAAEGCMSIAAVIAAIAAGSGRGADELYVGVDEDGGELGRAVVASGFVMPRQLACDAASLLGELRALLALAREF